MYSYVHTNVISCVYDAYEWKDYFKTSKVLGAIFVVRLPDWYFVSFFFFSFNVYLQKHIKLRWTLRSLQFKTELYL